MVWLHHLLVRDIFHQSRIVWAGFLLLWLLGSTAAGHGQVSTTMASSVSTPDATTLNGVVVNAVTGAPIPRALVQFSGRALLTDHDGRFVFSNIDNTGSIGLRVTKPGYYATPDGEASLTTTLTQAQVSSIVTMRLYPEAVLTGTVSSGDGVPLPHVLVTAQQSVYSDDGHQWRTVGQRQTNSRGEYRVPVSSGIYRIETGFLPRVDGTSKSVIPSLYPPISSTDTSDVLRVTAGTEQRVDLHPEVAATYAVPIHMEQGSERGFPMLTARSSTGAIIPANFYRGFDNGGGESRIQLPLGTYTLSASQNLGDVMEYGETNVTVTGPGSSPVTLHLDPVSPIPVSLAVDPAATSDNTMPTPQQLGLVLRSTQDANPMRPTSFRVELARDRSAIIRALPGTYRLTSPASGSWYIASASYGGADLLRQPLVVSAGGGSTAISLTISNLTGSLSGTVKLNGVPSSAWVYLIPSSPSTVAVYSVHSTPDGIFTLSRLPKGSYQAVAFELVHHDDYASADKLAPYSTWIRNVTVTAGNAASLDLDAVAASELQP